MTLMRRAKTNGKIGYRVALLIIALLGIIDGLVVIFTLTWIDSDLRASFLFSDLSYRFTGDDH